MKSNNKKIISLFLMLGLCAFSFFKIFSHENTMEKIKIYFSSKNSPSFLKSLIFTLKKDNSKNELVGEYISEGNDEYCQFENITHGKYLLQCSPDEESYADDQCIYYRYLNITKKSETIELNIPTSKAVLKLNFKTQPPLYKNQKLLIARLQKMKKDKLDTNYLQYVYFRQLKMDVKYWKGNMYYLDKGQYQLTFFTREKRTIKDLFSLKIDYKGEKDFIREGLKIQKITAD